MNCLPVEVGIHSSQLLRCQGGSVLRKPPHLVKRLPEILDRLARMSVGIDPEECSAAMLIDAFQWFYKSGKHTFDGYGKFNFENNLESFEVLDALLEDDPDATFQANKVLQAKYAPPVGRLAGYRSNDSNICISPNFADSFKLIPTTSKQLVVEKLKELAKLTSDDHSDRQKRIKSKATLTNGLVTLPVGPGIHLCIEFEDVLTTAFLGFLVPGTYRPMSGGLVSSNSGGIWLNTLAKAAFALSLLALIGAMLYVPYDVVLTGKGPTLHVFNGFDFAWANPDLNAQCAWYAHQSLEVPTIATRYCYSALALPRMAMTVGAAAVLALGSFLWMKGTSRNRM